MEKRGDLLNQLAIITDLVEKLNITSESSTLIFGLNETEFNNVFEYIQKKQNKKSTKPDKTFTITIGLVDIIFNKNSV
jgi:hypothetical protein